jgi:hypothetical protein
MFFNWDLHFNSEILEKLNPEKAYFAKILKICGLLIIISSMIGI